MKPITQRTAYLSILASAIIFGIALVTFCYSLGLDFANEGWAQPQVGQTSVVNKTWLWASITGFCVSTVLFFIGLHRVARS